MTPFVLLLLDLIYYVNYILILKISPQISTLNLLGSPSSPLVEFKSNYNSPQGSVIAPLFLLLFPLLSNVLSPRASINSHKLLYISLYNSNHLTSQVYQDLHLQLLASHLHTEALQSEGLHLFVVPKDKPITSCAASPSELTTQSVTPVRILGSLQCL